MTCTRTIKLLGLAGCALVLAACDRSVDMSAGEQLAQDAGCVQCHGTNGKGTGPTFPNINGQRENYLYQQLLKYRSGERQNAIMNAQSSELSDADIELLAAYYARQ